MSQSPEQTPDQTQPDTAPDTAPVQPAPDTGTEETEESGEDTDDEDLAPAPVSPEVGEDRADQGYAVYDLVELRYVTHVFESKSDADKRRKALAARSTSRDRYQIRKV